MKVAFIWEDCDFLNRQWDSRSPVDSYVVGGTPEEIKNQIVPHLTLDQDYDVEKAKINADPDGNLWFLVAKDLSSVVGIHWYYPVSHMWNGASPFQVFRLPNGQMKQINSLQDLQNLGRRP